MLLPTHLAIAATEKIKARKGNERGTKMISEASFKMPNPKPMDHNPNDLCRPGAVPRGVEEAVRVRGRARARRLRQEGRRGKDRGLPMGQDQQPAAAVLGDLPGAAVRRRGVRAERAGHEGRRLHRDRPRDARAGRHRHARAQPGTGTLFSTMSWATHIITYGVAIRSISCFSVLFVVVVHVHVP